MYSAGLPQYGQLGHGTDHEYNMNQGSVKLAYEAQPAPRLISALSERKVLGPTYSPRTYILDTKPYTLTTNP